MGVHATCGPVYNPVASRRNGRILHERTLRLIYQFAQPAKYRERANAANIEAGHAAIIIKMVKVNAAADQAYIL